MSPQKELTWLDAIKTILAQSEVAMHYSAVSDEIVQQGLKATLGATPAATVGAQLYISVKKLDSPFEKTGKGYFKIKAASAAQDFKKPKVAKLKGPSSSGNDVAVSADVKNEVVETGALQAFGMYWRRDEVIWSGKPKLLGRQQAGSDSVNFSEQVGVYLLHDRDRVIYVGRAADTLFKRLQMHTSDRLAGRWDRFSWFGLRGVLAESGNLTEPAVAWNYNVVIDTLEALLIESLEPPLNRKRGDGLAAVEYYQIADPEIEKSKKLEIISLLVKQAGLGS